MKSLIKAIALIDGLIFAVMAVVTAMTSARYGNLLLWSGIVVAIVGGMSVGGSDSLAGGEYNLKYDQKIPQLNYHRTDDKLREMNKSYDFGLLMAAAGTVAIAAGLILN